MREFKAAVKALDLVLKYHPCGLGVLLGTYPPPDAAAWNEILSLDRPATEAVRVHGGSPSERLLLCVARADEMDRIVDAMGGWEGVRRATEAVRDDYPDIWRHFVRYLDRVEGASAVKNAVAGCSPREALAEELGVSPITLTKHRQEVPFMIARKAMNPAFSSADAG